MALAQILFSRIQNSTHMMHCLRSSCEWCKCFDCTKRTDVVWIGTLFSACFCGVLRRAFSTHWPFLSIEKPSKSSLQIWYCGSFQRKPGTSFVDPRDIKNNVLCIDRSGISKASLFFFDRRILRIISKHFAESGLKRDPLVLLFCSSSVLLVEWSMSAIE